ncbi:IucA/IucC family protein [Shewanella surugensis]|uniref:IucA/IucC family siderophore biosynthesis protein n=1 Tax=Shewanella surugensis TaxID=212020 RepID=A0ABT0LE46_9GAMM|nr:IucA/IucC family protein [Shewanella surugensis]MCL1125421.1 hypothetical protein [Shewanella surugensis]
MSAEHYITERIINTCLRENVSDIMTQGQIVSSVSDRLLASWPQAIPDFWLKVNHLGDRCLYLPIKPTHYMQEWQAVSATWLMEGENGGEYQQGYQDWLAALAVNLSEDEARLFTHYVEEANCACEHRMYAEQAYGQQTDVIETVISGVLETEADWQQQLLLSDQIAAYLDHPYYPTARAKVGFTAEELTQYAPEFAPIFELNWLAVKTNYVSVTSEQPDCWPSFSQVGLSESLSETHILFPIHPLTLKGLDTLPDGIILADKAAIRVKPTLSVRTLALMDFAGFHIKVPLLMATLGAKNIRLIKPSTLYDGHWFEKALSRIVERDVQLHDLYSHVNEQHGGHVGEYKELAYILRQYPQSMQDKHLVPVAALASAMPDGRLYLEHLADAYYQGNYLTWLNDYLALLLKVHLRLWLKYGIVLESNQQNAVLGYQQGALSLIMKDNDSARLLASRYVSSSDDIDAREAELLQLIDQRIFVEDDEALAKMFITITIQLDIAAVFEAMAVQGLADIYDLYQVLRQAICHELDDLQAQGIETEFARHYLLEQGYQPVKYLLSSGSLLSKAKSGATDVNKFYGLTAPNFLHQDFFKKYAKRQLSESLSSEVLSSGPLKSGSLASLNISEIT